MKNNFLLAISIILAVVFLFTGCQKTTQEDIDKQGTRWLAILYKMTDGANNEQAFELISQPRTIVRTTLWLVLPW